MLTEIWVKHLGHQNFGVEDNFFEAGGHSLTAAGISAEICARCGVSLPLALLFQKPTIAALAQAIAEETKRSGSSHLIPVQPAGSKPPIFALFGVGGSYAAYAVVAKELGPDQPFYSFEMPGLAGESVPLERIEAVASRFLDEIRDVRAREPCVLIGACAGALVVYELAHYLKAEGRAVKLVVMMDPPATGGSRLRSLSSHRLWRRLILPRFLLGRVRLHLRAMVTLHGHSRLSYVKQKLSVLRNILSERDLFRASRHELNATRVLEATSAALTAFVPQPYAGRVTLLLGERYGPGGLKDPALEWRKLCTGPFEVLRISGQDTGAMLKQPHVRAWVARLNEILDVDQLTV